MAQPENKEVMKNRSRVAERLSNRFPEKDFSEDEALMGQIADDYDDYDKQIAAYKDREQQFSDLFTKDPRSAAFLMDWKNGQDPVRSLIKNYGLEIKEALEDPENSKLFAEDNQEYLKRVAENSKLKEEYDKNIVATNALIDDFQGKGNYSDEAIDKAVDYIVSAFKDLLVGKIAKETLEMAMKATNFEQAVAEAEETGEVRGKNAKIEEKLRKKGSGDGLPALDGKNAGAASSRQRPSLGALDRYDDGNQTIWERGGEKRTKR